MRKIEPDYKRAVHLDRSENSNVYCYNGSAHLRRTNHEDHVTCAECLKRYKEEKR
jgi:hypothetical protein